MLSCGYHLRMTIYGMHDLTLVILSVALAIFASFTALNLADRARASSGRVQRSWLAVAALVLGGGIWSMHFVAMLAFSMPGIEMSYDVGLTLLSLALAIGFTGAGFAIGSRGLVSPYRIIVAGTLMGRRAGDALYGHGGYEDGRHAQLRTRVACGISTYRHRGRDGSHLADRSRPEDQRSSCRGNPHGCRNFGNAFCRNEGSDIQGGYARQRSTF